MSNNASLEEVEKLKDSLETFQDKNQKVKAVNLVKNHLAEFKKLARESGLRMNEDFLKNLIYLIQYGYGGQFEIQVPFEDKTHNIYFSALIKREKLKENESLIIRKHGRTSEK